MKQLFRNFEHYLLLVREHTMSVEITMPQLSDTMSEGRILTWLKKEGDKIKRGDALAEVATDKADLEIESFHEGTLLQISAPAGTVVRVGSVIALIGETGEAVAAPTIKPQVPAPQAVPVSAPPKAAPLAAPVAPVAPAAPAVVATQPSMNVTPPASVMHSSSVATEDRVKISPLARNVAQAHGVNFSELAGRGTGEGGRIVRRDIEAQLAQGRNGGVPSATASSSPAQFAAVNTVSNPTASSPTPTPVGARLESLSRMRQTIASRMVESVTTIPHFYVTTKVLMDAAVKLRSSLKTLQQYEGITFNHLVTKAAALALRKHPVINTSYNNGNIVQPQDINIGIVTAVEGGLLIPVVKNADTLPLADIVSEGRSLVQRARTGRPKSDDLVGGTFSISNMGMFAVESFTAIISPGQGSIMAISAIDTEPVVADGTIRPGQVMRVTLSVDHRIIDGVMAGEFLTEFKRLLEDPVLLLA